MIVKLAWHEMTMASQVGMRRQLSAMSKNRPDRYGAGTTTKQQGVFDKHIVGAYGECVISKFKNLHWNPSIGHIKKPDFFERDGSKFQVRTTQMLGGELIVHRPNEPNGSSDHPDQKFYGVRMNPFGVNNMNVFEVTGWIIARDAQVQEHWAPNAPWPAYFVPREKLNKLDEAECAAYLARAEVIDAKEE